MNRAPLFLRIPPLCLSFIVFLLSGLLPCTLRGEVSMRQDVRQFDNRSGLSHNTVYCVHQDSQGFMWFGTRYGLDRYDGCEFRVYHHDGSPGSIAGEYIKSMAEDADGCLWIGSDGGLSVYDPRLDAFSTLPLVTADGKNVEGIVTKIQYADDGTLWFLSGSNLCCYRDSTLTLLSFDVPLTAVHTFYIWRDNLYVALSDGLLRSTDGGTTFRRVADYTFTPSVLYEYGIDGLLVGTRAEGLYWLDLPTGTLSLLPLFGDDMHDASQFYANAITRIDDDTFLVGAEWGLYRLGHDFLTPVADSTSPGVDLDVVFDICQDRESGIWVANNFSGVNYAPGRPSMFACYSAAASPRSISGDVVRAVAEDATGDLWIGTEDGGLCRFNSLTGDFVPVISSDGFDLSKIDIQDLVLVGGEELAMGTYRGGLYVYNIHSGHLRHYMDKSDVLTVYARAGRSLLFTAEGSIYHLDLHADGMPVRMLQNINGVCDLAEDHRGRIWIPTNDGLLRYNPSDGTTKAYRHDHANASSLCADRLSQIFIDSRDRVWLSSEGGGLCCYEEHIDAFHTMTRRDGLPGDAVNTLTEDGDGHLWAGTSDGLALIDPTAWQVLATYNTDNGMASKHVTLKSAVRLRSGRLAFGTFAGLLLADPSQDNQHTPVPAVTLTGLSIYNEEVRPQSSILDSTLPYTRSIVLPPGSRTFTLAFTTFDYKSESHGTYAYRLEGQDEQWNYVDDANHISYHNVPPGQYKLRIRAVDSHTGQTGPETQLAVRVRPHWWNTVGMRIVYIVALLSLLVLVQQQVIRRKHYRDRLRQAEQDQAKEKELLQAKMDFFTNIAHEIRTPASLIRDPLHTLRLKGVSPDVDRTLALVERNADSLNQLINELLDFRKVEAGGGPVDPRPEDFCALVRDVWEGFRPAAAGRGLRVSMSLPAGVLLAYVDADATRKILRNLFSNAQKYAQSYIRIAVVADAPTGNVRLTLTNDGHPIPADMREKLFEPFVQIRDDRMPSQGTGLGLPLARRLAQKQSGSLIIDGEAADNTFVLLLPLAAQPEPSGVPEVPADDPSATADASADPETADTRTCVLVVEDNDDLRNYLATCLSEAYRILEAPNGREALSQLRLHDVQLVLSDVMMPVKDGLTLCRDIKGDADLCHIPVVLLTAKDTVADQVRGLEGGADVYIPKPFDMEQLRAQIASLLLNRQLLRHTFAHDPQCEPLALAHSPGDEHFLTAATACVLKHIEETEWNIDDLSAQIGMSRSTFARKLSGLTGQKPGEFVRLIRLRRAAELLREEHYRLGEVATMVGFSNPHYFSTLFQQQFGIKPSEYADSNAKK